MDVYERTAELLSGTTSAVAFTGAGISAESNIPTFRDPGGIWDQFDPEEFGTTEGIMDLFQREPERIRQFFLNTIAIFEQAKPNPAHDALVELEKMSILSGVITQNVDNLHTDAGNRKVYEVHGNLFRTRCTRCGRRYPQDKARLLQRAREILSDRDHFGLSAVLKILPACECGGITRPDVVMFGEAVLELNASFKAAAGARVMLVLGTSGVVYPAAAVPTQAHQAGAKVIEINPSENCYANLTEIYIPEPSGQAMPKVMEKLKRMKS